MTEPRTKAGRALLSRHAGHARHGTRGLFTVTPSEILAIEAEARSEGPGLDALIADAVEAHFGKGRHGMSLHACGNAVAMDVRAALAAQENPEAPDD